MRAVHAASPSLTDVESGLEGSVDMTLVPFNGSSGERFQVVNQRPDRLGWCLLGHTVTQIEDERPIAIGGDDPLRLGDQS